MLPTTRIKKQQIKQRQCVPRQKQRAIAGADEIAR